MNAIASTLSSLPWFAWVGLAAIASGFVNGVIRMHYTHVERLAMIQQGMNPDDPQSAAKPIGVEDL